MLPLARSVIVTVGYDLKVGQVELGNKLNGTYDVVDACGGWYRYRKIGVKTGDVWLEYCSAKGQWQLKPSAYKDTPKACKSIIG